MASTVYCPTCGIELVDSGVTCDCDIYFFNQFMDSTEPGPSNIGSWERAHGRLTFDDAYLRWPGGIEGKIAPRPSRHEVVHLESSGSESESDARSSATPAGTKFCGECGTKFTAADVKFCGECGTKRA